MYAKARSSVKTYCLEQGDLLPKNKRFGQAVRELRCISIHCFKKLILRLVFTSHNVVFSYNIQKI